MRSRRRRRSYKFTEKTHSKRGIIATALALALFLWYLVFVNLAFRAQGQLSTYYGSAGVMAMLLSVVLVFFVAGSLKEDSYKLFPRLGLGLSLLTAFCWIGTFVWGICIG